MRRKDREMPESFALSLADSALWAVLSLVEPTGDPYGVPINIVRNDKTIYFHCATEGHKLDCLQHHKKVCLSFVSRASLAPEELTTKFQSAILRGDAEEVLDSAEKTRALQLLAEKFAPEHMQKAAEEIKIYLPRTSIWKVSIISATGKVNK